jgi:phosphohistidine phosphatase
MTARRQLIVMRHAKAGEFPGGPDEERSLRPRGRRDASAAGSWLAARGLVPDVVLCSKATRARQTWQYVGAELVAAPVPRAAPGPSAAAGPSAAPVPRAASEVCFDPHLYQADARLLLDIIAGTRPDVRTLMYVGHNPAAADVTEILTGQPADLRTAGIAVIGLDVSWDALAGGGGADGSGELIASWAPTDDS